MFDILSNYSKRGFSTCLKSIDLFAEELIAYGSVSPMRYEQVSVMFLDIVEFTASAKKVEPNVLISALEFYFEAFDEIIGRHHLEKIKTIGDGYMCAGGLPIINDTHALDCVMAANEIHGFINEKSDFVLDKYQVTWDIRIGINTGPVVAGVIGKKRFAYDIWGDTVNIASRMESYGENGKINISASTLERVKLYIEFRSRGLVSVTDKVNEQIMVEMFVIEKLKLATMRMYNYT